MITKDLGAVTAYAYAVEGGYTGTEEEFTQLMADLGITVDEFEHFSVSVSTLPAGSSATASYSDGVLSLGIPKGDKGDTGNTGATGATPNLSIGTVETTAEPSVTITGTVDNPVLNFGLVKGDKGETGEVSEAELTQAFEDFSANGTVANAEQLTTDIRANDQTPYLFRTSGGSVDIGDREYINGIVGGTVAFNQLVANSYRNYEGNTGAESYAGISFFFRLNASPYTAFYQVYRTSTGLFAFIKKATATGKAEMIHNGSVTQMKFANNMDVVENHYYLGMINFTSLDASTVGGVVAKDIQLFDLTQMFGSTIADYIYSLETATAGAGVAFFKTLFPKPYYAYNAGELMSVKGLVSHDMVGFNQWDGTYSETGKYLKADGTTDNSSGFSITNYIKVVPNSTYCFHDLNVNASTACICWYDSEKNFISSHNISDNTFTDVSPANAAFVRCSASTARTETCINIAWDNSRNGEYEPYELHSYPLDSDVVLRGIPKLDANNNLYYDGDVYEADGTVTRKYGIVDLGTLNWSYSGGTDVRFYSTGLINAKAVPSATVPNMMCGKLRAIKFDDFYANTTVDKTISYYTSGNYLFVRDLSTTDPATFKASVSGVYLVYELATPTTETADPYTSPQIVSDFGTEEYVIDDDVFAIPVGHNTDYPVDLKAKLEMAPNSPSQGNGDYIVRQTNGTNEYVPLVIEEVLPQTPSSNGTYSLTLTVANGEATLSWT